MKVIDPATGWFEIVEVPCLNLDTLAIGNNEYRKKFPARVIKMFNKILLCRYPCPHKVVFDNGYELKIDFNPFL